MTLTGRGPPASEPLAFPEPLTGVLAHARGIAADWSAAGLQVGLVEHASRDGRPDAHDLVARSPARVLHCACRPVASRAGRTLWTIEVSLGRCDEDRDGIEHVRLLPVGIAGPAAHEPAWRQVVDWIHGEGALHADPETAIARQAGPPTPIPRAAGGSRRKLSTGRPLFGGVLVCLGVLGLLVVSFGVAGWRFSKRDERAYRHYARLCAAAVRAGEDTENEFWCQRARELRASYGFAEVAGPPGGTVER